MGRNKPHRNNIGNRKKLENVCASNTSFDETAIIRPRSVEVTAIKKTANRTAPQLIPARSIKKDANSTGTKALNSPNKIAPESLAATIALREIGASRSRSKERPFLSKVMVTAVARMGIWWSTENRQSSCSAFTPCSCKA